jgi:nucleotide-binding universal stress UspA family protein
MSFFYTPPEKIIRAGRQIYWLCYKEMSPGMDCVSYLYTPFSQIFLWLDYYYNIPIFCAFDFIYIYKKINMKTFLVPVDFSATSVNAAEYAVTLAKEITGVDIILYNVYSRISVASLTEKEKGSRKMVTESELKRLKRKLRASDDQNISVESEEGSFIDNLERYVLSNHIDMVIMGITGSSRIKQVFMGTNTLNVIRHIKTPVMIIPPKAEFSGLKNVLFTSDFKDVARTTPFDPLKKILDLFKPNLHILNVDSEHYIELTDEFKIERAAMEEKLDAYNPEFSFLRAYDFLDGINRFAEVKEIDAIITVPRTHNFLSQLFKTSHTKKLAYHSHVPIIAIHC